MGGIPVVVSTNGLGIPVRPVDNGAPLMTVATNGLGAPIVITDNGAPFIVEGIDPTPMFSTITAGANNLGNVHGYSNGRMSEEYGSKVGEPMPGVVMVDISTTIGSLQIAVTGNLSDLQGKSIWVDDVEYVPTVDWYAFSELFSCEVWPKPFDFIVGNNYKIELK